MKIHDFEFRIYYKDTDASGIAYHANYLSYAERTLCGRVLSPAGYKHLGLKTPTQYVQPDLLEDEE